jgi:hypothetical protein
MKRLFLQSPHTKGDFMKSHAQPSDIPKNHLIGVCRESTPCQKLDFRPDEDGNRVITCSKGKEVRYPSLSGLNKGTQFTHCSGAPEYQYTQITSNSGNEASRITIKI